MEFYSWWIARGCGWHVSRTNAQLRSTRTGIHTEHGEGVWINVKKYNKYNQDGYVRASSVILVPTCSHHIDLHSIDSFFYTRVTDQTPPSAAHVGEWVTRTDTSRLAISQIGGTTQRVIRRSKFTSERLYACQAWFPLGMGNGYGWNSQERFFWLI